MRIGDNRMQQPWRVANLVGEMGQEAASRRDNVAKPLTPAQLAQAQEMTRQCRAKNFRNCD
jgi:hypothetical protein